MKESYTKEEVIQLLLKERKRGRDIAYAFKDDNDTKHKWQEKSGLSIAFVSENVANECRLIGNTIAGLNGLSHAVGETMESKLRKDFDRDES